MQGTAAGGRPGPDGAEALALFLDLPGRDEGPLSGELYRAAADQAEATGAPLSDAACHTAP